MPNRDAKNNCWLITAQTTTTAACLAKCLTFRQDKWLHLKSTSCFVLSSMHPQRRAPFFPEGNKLTRIRSKFSFISGFLGPRVKLHPSSRRENRTRASDPPGRAWASQQAGVKKIKISPWGLKGKGFLFAGTSKNHTEPSSCNHSAACRLLFYFAEVMLFFFAGSSLALSMGPKNDLCVA